MIVQCCICKVIEGVKCPKCGEFLKEEGTPQSMETYARNRYMCTNTDCHILYRGMDGGVSHGFCRPCLDTQLAKVHGTPEFQARVDRIAADIDQRGLRVVLGNYNVGCSVEVE